MSEAVSCADHPGASVPCSWCFHERRTVVPTCAACGRDREVHPVKTRATDCAVFVEAT